ncbi:hypothetical protein PG984_008476 [Apiospora sp. TS-2023a]
MGNPATDPRSPPQDPNYEKTEYDNPNDYITNVGPNFDDKSEDGGEAPTGFDGLVTLPMPSTNPLFQQLQNSLQQAPQSQANQTLAKRAETRAKRFVAQKKVPQIPGWDWVPFLSAIFEFDTQVPLDDDEDAINFVEGEDGGDDSIKSTTVVNTTGPTNQPTPIPSTLEPDQRPSKGDAHRGKVTNKPPPPKQPGDGSWNYVVYVPDWSDPAWDPTWERIYGTDKKRLRPQSDVFHTLRPALRPEDAVRNPTASARRWGIPGDRTDGRSRTSPTFSRTRDFGAVVDDILINQVMDDAMRQRCFAETQRLIAQGSTAYRGQGIAPEVVEQYRQAMNIPSQEDIRTGAVKAGMPFERYIETLPQDVRQLYSGLIDDVLDDEDYQRILFFDMTSDEMYRNNIFTMSDNEKYNLTPKPLHTLVDKSKWEDTLFKGADKEYPRLVYDFWGKRDEYDVHRNPTVWEALQPALQLVTRVLNTNPMFWRCLKDLRTRRKVDPKLDPRKAEDQVTPYLQKMIRLDEIKMPGEDGYEEDYDARWPELDDLAEDGFDYPYHVDRLLANHLELGFNSGFLDDDGQKCDFTYGHTGMIGVGVDTKIQIMIAAELLWPLLVPVYSSSEKLCASYIIATTILHELMHATNNAIDLLCGLNDELYDPAQTKEITNKLYVWSQGAIDSDCGHGEPWWRDDVRCEAGWAFEADFWGDSCVVLTGAQSGYRISKHLHSLPLAVMTQRHQHASYSGSNDVLKGIYPIEDYYRPVPIDYVAKFFTDGFWDTEYPRHGAAAFKRLPPDRQHLSLMMPGWQPGGRAAEHLWFGRLALLPRRHPIVWEVRGFHSLRNRWILDIQSWQVPDETWSRLNAQLEDSTDVVWDRWRCYSNPTDEQYQTWLMDKYKPYPDHQRWVEMMLYEFLDETKDGGRYFTNIETIHRFAKAELSIMERMVFEFLSVRKGQRRYVYRPDSDFDPLLQLVNRMVEYKETIDAHRSKLDDLQMCAALLSESDRITTWCAYLDQDSQRLHHLSNLVLTEWQIDNAEAKRLREEMPSVPSALYEKRSNRLKKLAMRDYVQLDYRIRGGVDEFYKRIEGWVGKMARPDPINQKDLEATKQRVIALQKRLQKTVAGADSLGIGTPMRSVSPKKTNNIFAFKNLESRRSSVVDDATRRPGTTMGFGSSAGAPNKIGGVSSSGALVFGKPGFSSATAQPRRTTGPKPITTSANAFTKFTNNPLQSNLLDPAPKFAGRNFASQANIVAPPNTVFGRLQLPAGGNPFAATNASMMPTAPFPYPYADRNTTSRDVASLTHNPTPTMQLLLTALQLPTQPYRQSEHHNPDVEDDTSRFPVPGDRDSDNIE